MPSRSRNRASDQAEPKVGDVVEIYWEQDDEFYLGRLATRLSGPELCFTVHYDDGEKENVRLAEEKWRFAGPSKKRERSSSKPLTSVPQPVPTTSQSPDLQTPQASDVQHAASSQARAPELPTERKSLQPVPSDSTTPNAEATVDTAIIPSAATNTLTQPDKISAAKPTTASPDTTAVATADDSIVTPLATNTEVPQPSHQLGTASSITVTPVTTRSANAKLHGSMDIDATPKTSLPVTPPPETAKEPVTAKTDRKGNTVQSPAAPPPTKRMRLSPDSEPPFERRSRRSTAARENETGASETTGSNKKSDPSRQTLSRNSTKKAASKRLAAAKPSISKSSARKSKSLNSLTKKPSNGSTKLSHSEPAKLTESDAISSEARPNSEDVSQDQGPVEVNEINSIGGADGEQKINEEEGGNQKENDKGDGTDDTEKVKVKRHNKVKSNNTKEDEGKGACKGSDDKEGTRKGREGLEGKEKEHGKGVVVVIKNVEGINENTKSLKSGRKNLHDDQGQDSETPSSQPRRSRRRRSEVGIAGDEPMQLLPEPEPRRRRRESKSETQAGQAPRSAGDDARLPSSLKIGQLAEPTREDQAATEAIEKRKNGSSADASTVLAATTDEMQPPPKSTPTRRRSDRMHRPHRKTSDLKPRSSPETKDDSQTEILPNQAHTDNQVERQQGPSNSSPDNTSTTPLKGKRPTLQKSQHKRYSQQDKQTEPTVQHAAETQDQQQHSRIENKDTTTEVTVSPEETRDTQQKTQHTPRSQPRPKTLPPSTQLVTATPGTSEPPLTRRRFRLESAAEIESIAPSPLEPIVQHERTGTPLPEESVNGNDRTGRHPLAPTTDVTEICPKESGVKRLKPSLTPLSTCLPPSQGIIISPAVEATRISTPSSGNITNADGVLTSRDLPTPVDLSKDVQKLATAFEVLSSELGKDKRRKEDISTDVPAELMHLRKDIAGIRADMLSGFARLENILHQQLIEQRQRQFQGNQREQGQTQNHRGVIGVQQSSQPRQTSVQQAPNHHHGTGRNSYQPKQSSNQNSQRLVKKLSGSREEHAVQTVLHGVDTRAGGTTTERKASLSRAVRALEAGTEGDGPISLKRDYSGRLLEEQVLESFNSGFETLEGGGGEHKAPVKKFLHGGKPSCSFSTRVLNLIAKQVTVCLLESPHGNDAGLDFGAWAKHTSYCVYIKVAEQLSLFRSYTEAYHTLARSLGSDSELEWFMRPSAPSMLSKARNNYRSWKPPPSDDEWRSEMVLLREVATGCHAAACRFVVQRSETEVEAAVSLAHKAVELYREAGYSGGALLVAAPLSQNESGHDVDMHEANGQGN